jgi:hypothetical protein
MGLTEQDFFKGARGLQAVWHPCAAICQWLGILTGNFATHNKAGAVASIREIDLPSSLNRRKPPALEWPELALQSDALARPREARVSRRHSSRPRVEV